MPTEDKTFMIEDAQLIFRNFSGEKTMYNDRGDRLFSVVLTPEAAEELSGQGWLVKQLRDQDDGTPGEFYIQVKVQYKYKPPKITMITSTARTPMSEDIVGMLDYADIRVADLICRAYEWEVGEKTGTKAYLQTLFVTIEEDALERKYAIDRMD